MLALITALSSAMEPGPSPTTLWTALISAPAARSGVADFDTLHSRVNDRSAKAQPLHSLRRHFGALT
jgi:hypothetical protein